MRRTLDKTERRGRMGWVLAGAMAVALAGAWGCESATQSSLTEYEKLVARRRTENQQRMQGASVGSAQAADTRSREAEAKAAEARAASERAAAEKAAAKKAAAEKASAAKRAASEKAAAEKAAADRAAAEMAAEKAATEERIAAEREAREAAERAAAEAEARAAAERAAREAAEREARAAGERAAAEAATASAVAATPSPAGAESSWEVGVYRLKKGDIVQIALRGIPESQLIDDSLDEFGMISLPFINELKAEGLTASELEQSIRNRYRDDQIYPNVTVQVQVPTRYYFMQGEIRGPGRVQLVSATRLSQAIAASGGGTEFWNGKVLLRRNGEIYRKIKNAKKLEKYPEDDILLEPGDIVELSRSSFF